MSESSAGTPSAVFLAASLAEFTDKLIARRGVAIVATWPGTKAPAGHRTEMPLMTA